jgi:hypothetical protein
MSGEINFLGDGSGLIDCTVLVVEGESKLRQTEDEI